MADRGRSDRSSKQWPRRFRVRARLLIAPNRGKRQDPGFTSFRDVDQEGLHAASGQAPSHSTNPSLGVRGFLSRPRRHLDRRLERPSCQECAGISTVVIRIDTNFGDPRSPVGVEEFTLTGGDEVCGRNLTTAAIPRTNVVRPPSPDDDLERIPDTPAGRTSVAGGPAIGVTRVDAGYGRESQRKRRPAAEVTLNAAWTASR